jgi:hypothetical protein
MLHRNLIILAITAGVLVAGVLLFALWPGRVCDLSPCTVNPPTPGTPCIAVRIAGPCPVMVSTIVVPLVAGFAAAALVVVMGLIKRRKGGQSSL